MIYLCGVNSTWYQVVCKRCCNRCNNHWAQRRKNWHLQQIPNMGLHKTWDWSSRCKWKTRTHHDHIIRTRRDMRLSLQGCSCNYKKWKHVHTHAASVKFKFSSSLHKNWTGIYKKKARTLLQIFDTMCWTAERRLGSSVNSRKKIDIMSKHFAGLLKHY